MRKLVLAGAWALFTTYVYFQIMQEHHESVFVFLLASGLMGWLPFALCLRLEMRRARRRLELLALAGLAEGESFSNFYAGEGVALNAKERTLCLMDSKSMKSYGYQDIRRWERRVDTVGILTFEMKDSSHPKWSVKFAQVSESIRWMEVLEQEINEGGVAA